MNTYETQGQSYFMQSCKMFGVANSLKTENLEKLAKSLDLEFSWVKMCIEAYCAE